MNTAILKLFIKHQLKCKDGSKIPEALTIEAELFFSQKEDSCTGNELLANEISFILEEGLFASLEEAAYFLVRWVLAPSPNPKTSKCAAVRIVLTCMHTGTSVSQKLYREASFYEQETKPWGTVDLIAENTGLGLYRLNIYPGKSIPCHYHTYTQEAEFILDSGVEQTLDCKTYRPLQRGDCFIWQVHQKHGYLNSSQEIKSILCLDAPKFNYLDEIEC